MKERRPAIGRFTFGYSKEFHAFEVGKRKNFVRFLGHNSVMNTTVEKLGELNLVWFDDKAYAEFKRKTQELMDKFVL